MEQYLLTIRALAEPTRLRIIHLLRQDVPHGLCVCEIVDALQQNQYNISRHLQVLCRATLVTGDRRGKWVAYRLSRRLDLFRGSLLSALDTIPAETFLDDVERLHVRLTLRVDGECVVGFGGTMCDCH